MLQRLKRKINYCSRYLQDDIELFRPPEIRNLNVLPISSETILASGGELNKKYLKAKVKLSDTKFEEGDRAYIYVLPPEELDPLCSEADYMVQSVLIGHMVTEVIFEKIACFTLNIY